VEKLKLLKEAPETGIEQLRAKAIEYMLRLSVKKEWKLRFNCRGGSAVLTLGSSFERVN
jgi:hypothetical protein